ncbi:restriction endonuclease subunit S [Bacteroides acidifaciens]|uniref:restriction endonuclease subunit S n=1 Tax=Bacteroides acidifaciens TaxID=85831 RepID=UPI0025B3DC46|nr:restriction endonuclease subunit S [Bacteroides acidifaciens]
MTKYKFDEIAINSTQKKKPTEEDKVYYIGLEHIDPGCFDVVRWGSDVAPTGDKLLMQKGDVLFGKRRAYQRKVAIAPFDGIFSAHGMVLRPNLKVIDANYFPFFISSDKFMETAVRISVGGLSPTINWKDLARQEFELPSLDEQKVLADKLWAAYRLKEAYKKLLVATDEMVKSQFIEMFDFNDLSLTSPANDFSKYCKDDTSSATKIVAGDYLSKGIYPIYDQSKDNTIAGYTNKKEGLCDNVPAVLFGDHSRVIKYINTPFFIGADGVKIIRPKINEIIPEFLYYDLKYHTIPNTGYNRHFKFVKMLKLTKASMEKQNEFLLIARQADKSKFELRKSIDAIDKVIRSLING